MPEFATVLLSPRIQCEDFGAFHVHAPSIRSLLLLIGVSSSRQHRRAMVANECRPATRVHGSGPHTRTGNSNRQARGSLLTSDGLIGNLRAATKQVSLLETQRGQALCRSPFDASGSSTPSTPAAKVSKTATWEQQSDWSPLELARSTPKVRQSGFNSLRRPIREWTNSLALGPELGTQRVGSTRC